LRASNPWDITWLPLGVQRGNVYLHLPMRLLKMNQKTPKRKGDGLKIVYGLELKILGHRSIAFEVQRAILNLHLVGS